MEKVYTQLKSAVRRKQVVLIEPNRYTLKNIKYVKNHLLLHLSSQSVRRKCLKPISINESSKLRTKLSERDRFERLSTEKSLLSDWMLEQKFAVADCIQSDFNGFLG